MSFGNSYDVPKLVKHPFVCTAIGKHIENGYAAVDYISKNFIATMHWFWLPFCHFYEL